MTINVKFDAILGKLRESDVGLVSTPSIAIPDPLIINNLQVLSNASIRQINANQIYASTATIGNINTNNLIVTSTATTNLINTVGIIASTATIRTAHISNIDWNLTSGSSLPVEGQMNWDSVNQTVVVGMAGGNVDVALGMETLFPKRVVNSTATTMPKGSVVYINGVSGNDPTVTFAKATSDMTSAYTLGLTAETITAGQKGWVTTFGEITGLNLSAYTGGQTLYLSGATAGLFTNVKPQSPIHYVRIGTVVKATSDGTLVVNVINGFETDELHDVVIASLASGQILQSGASNLWYNRSLASAVNDFIVFPSFPSLGSLAVQNQLSYGSILNTPSLGSLANMNQLSFTSLTNQPSLSSLAFQSTVDYTTSQIINKPSLGSLALMNQLSFTSLTNQPSLSSLAFQATIDYTSAQLTNKPALGSLAVMNQLSYGSILNTPSLGSLSVLNDLSYTSLLNLPSLGSLAQISNVVSPLVLSGATLSLSQASIVHNNLGGLTTGDPHTQYALLGGRTGGQNLIGGTGVNEQLFFQANTANSNTLTSPAFSWRAGNNGANTRMVLRQDGALGVNNTSPTGGLHVTSSLTANAGYERGLQVTYNINKTSGDAIGAFFDVTDVAGGVKTIYGHRARVKFEAFPAGTLTGLQATSNQAIVDFNNRVDYLEVLTSNVEVLNGASVGEAKLIRLFAPNKASGASIGTLIGLDLPDLTQGGTNWSIYSDGADMFHKGNVGIGVAPSANRVLTLSDTKNATFSYVAFNEGATEKWVIGTQSGEFGVFDAAANVFRMTFEPSGEIGMGTTNPDARLYVDQAGTTAVIPTLTLRQADLSEEFINFTSTIGTGNPIIASSTATTFSHKVRVSVNGTFKWLYLYNA